MQAVSDSGPVGTLLILLSIAAFAARFGSFVATKAGDAASEQQLTNLNHCCTAGGSRLACSALNDSFLTRAAPTSFGSIGASPMAVFELRASIEEAGEVEVAALHRQTEPIAVIGAIAPLIGLLGTVLGMIGAFDALGGGAKTAKVHCREHFAGLTTTLLGLVIAIPCVASVSWLRSRIDATAAGRARTGATCVAA